MNGEENIVVEPRADSFVLRVNGNPVTTQRFHAYVNGNKKDWTIQSFGETFKERELFALTAARSKRDFELQFLS